MPRINTKTQALRYAIDWMKEHPGRRKDRDYEITLKYVGKGKPPQYTQTDYGFGVNPPICVTAKDMASARKQLNLPKTIRIKRVKRV